MINFDKNNLDNASSPYLQQHKDNPIHWQEWSKEVLAYAKKNNKILFVSSGYATCHWCHVMAKEAFSDQEIAKYLNEYFVCIKIDREQRLDIDKYLMNFCQETQGQGGWPLNVFLTPDVRPFLAITYVPINPRYGLPGFLDLVQSVKQTYSKHDQTVPVYNPPLSQEHDVEEQELIHTIKTTFTGCGFGAGAQFPPHNILLFLLHYYEKSRDTEVKMILEKILEMIAMRGLHDHLQGGFYRYCVDESWTIPHFEKMLYDQAMLLWIYSLAYKVLHKPSYNIITDNIISCLEQTFSGTLYYSGHDADTDHHEGATYIWSNDELQQALTAEEFSQLADLYHLDKNFDGIHLVKKRIAFLPEIELKLLRVRKQRAQPFTDRKFITSWNALLCIALLINYRYTQNHRAKIKAKLLFKSILQEHYLDGVLHHSSYHGKLQSGEFLEDYAAMLLCATYLYEETGEHKDLIEMWSKRLNDFYEKNWMESKTADFKSFPAQTYDHPMPSSASLATMAKLRAAIILGKDDIPFSYKQALHYDFFNLTVSLSQGHWHIIHTPHKIEWKHLPANVMQLYDSKIQDCYLHQCKEFKNVTDLLGSLVSGV